MKNIELITFKKIRENSNILLAVVMGDGKQDFPARRKERFYFFEKRRGIHFIKTEWRRYYKTKIMKFGVSKLVEDNKHLLIYKS